MPATGSTFQDNLILVIDADYQRADAQLKAFENRLNAFSGQVKGVGAAQQDTAAKTDKATKSTEKQAKATEKASRSQEMLGGNMMSTSHSFRRLSGNVSTGNQFLDTFSMRLDRASMFMWRFNIAMIPLQQIEFQFAAITAGIVALEAAAVNTYRHVERMQATFMTMGDSAEDAAGNVEFLLEKAKNLPFTFNEITKAAMAFRTSGLAENREEMDRWLETAADLAAAGTTDQARDISRAAEALVDASTGEIRRLRNTYHVSSEMLRQFSSDTEEAAHALVESKWGGAAERQMETLDGALSHFIDSLTRLGVAWGEHVAGPLKWFLGMGESVVDRMTDMAEAIDGWAGGAAVITATFVPALIVLGTIIVRLGMQLTSFYGAWKIFFADMHNTWEVLALLTQQMNQLVEAEAAAFKQEMALSSATKEHAASRKELTSAMSMQATAQKQLMGGQSMARYESILGAARGGAPGSQQLAIPGLAGVEQLNSTIRQLGFISRETGIPVNMLSNYLKITGKSVTELTAKELDLLAVEAKRVGVLNQETVAVAKSASANEASAAAKQKEAAASAASAASGGKLGAVGRKLSGVLDSATFQMLALTGAMSAAMIVWGRFQGMMEETTEIYSGIASSAGGTAETYETLGLAPKGFAEGVRKQREEDAKRLEEINNLLSRQGDAYVSILERKVREGAEPVGASERKLMPMVEERVKLEDRLTSPVSPPTNERIQSLQREGYYRIGAGGQKLPSELQQQISQLREEEAELAAQQEEGKHVASELYEKRKELATAEMREAKIKAEIFRHYGREEMALQTLEERKQAQARWNEADVALLKDQIAYGKQYTNYLDLRGESEERIIQSYERLADANRILAVRYREQGDSASALNAEIAALNAEQAIQNRLDEKAEEQKKKLEEAEKAYIDRLRDRVALQSARVGRAEFIAPDTGLMSPRVFSEKSREIQAQMQVASAQEDYAKMYELETKMMELQRRRLEMYEEQRSSIIENRYELAQAYEEQKMMSEEQVRFYRNQVISDLQRRIKEEDNVAEKIALQTKLIKMQADETKTDYDNIVRRILGGPDVVEEAISTAQLMMRFGPEDIIAGGIDTSSAVKVVGRSRDTLTIELGRGSINQLKSALSGAAGEAFTRAFIEDLVKRLK